ncbi:MAG: ABC transporter ATP-binding protein/permease [Desulfobacterota bacterium]|nr:ABC transporter ATP-binding protein/permease [Thermodesulfobacteriota bacterium]
MKAFRTILPDLKKYIWFLVAGLISLLVVDILQLIIPRIIKKVIDGLTQGKIISEVLLSYGLKIIVLAILITIFRFFWRYFILGTAHRVERNLRFRLFSHLQTLPLKFLNQFSTGDIMAHATNDLNAIRMALGMALVALVDGVLLSLMAIVFMAHISPTLTFYALIPGPFMVILTNRVGKKVHNRFLSVQESFSQLTEKVRENFSGIRTVKVYIQEEDRLKKFSYFSQNFVQKNIDLIRIWGLFFPLVLGLINLSLGIVLIFGGKKTILFSITPGDFVAFLSYLGILTWPLIALGWVFNLLEQGAASMKRINTLLETPSEPSYYPPPAPQKSFSGKIEFKNLSFSYDNGLPILKNITFTINPGEHVALVGKIGSGKTTLLNLIFRLYEIKEGEICLDNINIKNIPLPMLRTNISYVPQDTFLFSDTIRENIIYGCPQVLEEKLISAAKVAAIYDEIMTFPSQFETLVGEKGIILSGGQKQRLAIARALIMEAPIIILDNSLSAVDTETEEKIMANLAPLINKKTTIIVTHRVTSVKDVNRIYVLDDGIIKEQGTHKTLITQGGIYAEMFRRQLIEKELEINNESNNHYEL